MVKDDGWWMLDLQLLCLPRCCIQISTKVVANNGINPINLAGNGASDGLHLGCVPLKKGAHLVLVMMVICVSLLGLFGNKGRGSDCHAGNLSGNDNH